MYTWVNIHDSRQKQRLMINDRHAEWRSEGVGIEEQGMIDELFQRAESQGRESEGTEAMLNW